MHKVAVFVGSLRRESLNLKLAKAIERLAKDSLSFHFAEIGDLPLYNDDLWEAPPEAVLRLKRDIEGADAVLFVTPEYNRSISPALKNAIDWGTRPWGKNSWAGKPGAIIGCSPGAVGTAAAQAHLRSLMAPIDIALMAQPEVYIVFKPDLVDEQGEIANADTRAFLSDFVGRFTTWTGRFV
jgi:chromate reductase